MRHRKHELAWTAFMKRQGGAHLLTGAFDENSGAGRRRDLALLRGLARALCKRGRYVVTTLRNSEGADLVMIAVEHRRDALGLSRTLGGQAAAPFGPWLSHISFTIDPAAYRRIALALSNT